MTGPALQLTGGSMTAAFSSSMGLSGLSNFMTSGGSNELDADLQAGGDTLNIEDVLSLLPSSGNWDTSNNNTTNNNNLGPTSASGNFSTPGSNPGSGGPPKGSNTSALNPVTHVSWSNIPGVTPQQAPQQQRRPMPINIPPNRSVGPGGIIGGIKSPISPGFSPTGQRSPGFATGNPQRRSPGAFGQMSPSPSGSIPGQRSPAGFPQQMSPMGNTQRSPAGGPLAGFPQSRTPTPGLMSPPPIGESVIILFY